MADISSYNAVAEVCPKRIACSMAKIDPQAIYIDQPIQSIEAVRELDSQKAVDSRLVGKRR